MTAAAPASPRQLLLAVVREAALTTLAIVRDEWSPGTIGDVWREREVVASRVLEDTAQAMMEDPDPEAPGERLVAMVEEAMRLQADPVDAAATRAVVGEPVAWDASSDEVCQRRLFVMRTEAEEWATSVPGCVIRPLYRAACALATAAEVAQAIDTIEFSRRTHVEWLDYTTRYPANGLTETERSEAEIAGDAEHHQKCIEGYNRVLRVLRSIVPAIADSAVVASPAEVDHA